MTTITVTFIYDFNINSNKIDKDKSNKKDVKKKGKKKTKAVPSKATNKKNEEEEKNEKISTTVKVKKPIRYLHIEYTLLPGKLNYKADVVFWGTIAKVFTSDGVKSMKSINKDGHCWIAFTINHKVVFTENELIKFKSSVAIFSSTTSKNKLSASAKKEGDKTFYFSEEDVALKSEFAVAYETIPEKIENLEVDFHTQNIIDIKYLLNDLLKFATLNEPQIELNILPDKSNKLKVLNIIEKHASNININCMNDLEEPLNVIELLSVKKGKQKKPKDKKKKNDISQITVPIELFFTDPYMSLYNLKLSNADVSNSFMCINVLKMMNSDQKQNLHPIVINIDKVVNFPTTILEKHGFSLMYITYNFCNIDYKTGARPISNITSFYDHRIYFIQKEHLEQFAQLIQHDFLIFQIYGIRPIINVKPGEMFGQNKMDKFISEPLQKCQDEIRKYNEGEIEINNKSVLLAISRVYLKDLIKPFWRIIKTEPCIHPRYLNYLSPKNNSYDKVTINEINIEYLNIFEQNPITEDLLLHENTCLNVQINLLNPIISILNDCIESDYALNRIFLIIHTVEKAKQIVFNIFIHNAHWTSRRNVAPNYLMKINSSQFVNSENIITGFSIDGMTNCIMFLEGDSKFIYQLLWAIFRREKCQDITILYNSDNVYQNRMYARFMNYGGVYFISTKVSLRYLLNNYKSYVKGYMPEPCRRVLQKLDMILKSSYLRDISDSILPTEKELLSFGLEWGVALHWPLK